MLRILIDPNIAPLRGEPREVRDLMIAANNAHIVAFDNVSKIDPWLSDAVCRLATGGGFATRELYSDGDEILFEAERPVIINSIEDVVVRGDLADRALRVTLPRIDSARRRTQREFWRELEWKQAGILGALLDIVAAVIRDQDRVHLPASLGWPISRFGRRQPFPLWAGPPRSSSWPTVLIVSRAGQPLWRRSRSPTRS